MNLRLIREPSRALATLGSLYVDDVWQCWTLEDAIREVPGKPVYTWKVPGETAIRADRYRVVLSRSQRFNRTLPELLHVEGFAGIRIHAGNKRQDSLGCILVGRDRGDAMIANSRLALEALMARLVDARDPIALAIENPPGYASASEA